MSRQSGCIYKSNNGERWLARWRENVIEGGEVKRKMRFRDLAPVSDRYRTERDVQPLLDEILQPINAGTAKPESTLSVADYGTDCWLPWARENCKPSTIAGYARFWRAHLEPRLQTIELRDFRTCDAANILVDLHRSTGCGRSMVKHAKSIMSGIFTLARNQGVLNTPNPVQGTMLPKKAAAPRRTHAASPDEVTAILDAIAKSPETAREYKLRLQAAIGLMFFAGLRPGEARGVCWEDYDGKHITVRQSVWHTYTTTPKTEESLQPVAVIEPLRSILAELRDVDGKPEKGPILRGTRDGRPADLDNLNKRVLEPILSDAKIQWHGWYALRRGIATTLQSVEKDPMAAKGHLRHSSVLTTQRHYIKEVPETTLSAMKKVEALFSDCSTEVKQ